jgi:hypothetical protein
MGKRQTKMLPTPKPRAEFLKGGLLAPLLNKQGRATFVVTGVPTEGTYGLDVPGRIGKTNFILTLDLEGSGYAIAHGELGGRPADWEGASLTLGTEVSKKTGNPYVVVLEAEEA